MATHKTAVLGALTSTTSSQGRRVLRRAAPVAWVGAVACLALAGWAAFRYGTPAAALGMVRGDVLWPDSRSRFVGRVRLGEASRASFTILNLSSHRVTLMGSTSSCGCASISGLPVDLEPAARYDLWFSVAARPEEGDQFEHTFTVYHDGSALPLLLTVWGFIEEKPVE